MTEGSDCPTGKEQFVAKDAARARVRFLARQGAKLHAYRCDMCGCYHVAHQRRAQKKLEILGR